jgi:hypothetical protein
MMHLIKIHAKGVFKTLSLITNTIAVAAAALQATGVLAMMPPMLNLEVAVAVIGLNMFTHALKAYVADPVASAVAGSIVAVPAVLVPAPTVTAAAV